MLADDRLDAAIEVGLETGLVLEPVVADELLNRGTGFPLRRDHLIAADVQVLVGKQRGDLAEQFVDEGVDALLRGVEGRVEDAASRIMA